MVYGFLCNPLRIAKQASKQDDGEGEARRHKPSPATPPVRPPSTSVNGDQSSNSPRNNAHGHRRVDLLPPAVDSVDDNSEPESRTGDERTRSTSTMAMKRGYLLQRQSLRHGNSFKFQRCVDDEL